ncbi:ABC transporter substrate-binding protein [Neobacillus niacini]|uniref:ABC transporter substrate-binding protein n=1 Tax=Neobacillus niacini TaxID=86668 RepID=UPI00300023D3
MMNKYFQLLFSVLLIVLLAACNGETTSNVSKNDSGKKVETSQGVTDKEILIGNSVPQSGPLAYADVVRKGMDTYFNYINKNGGVHGRQIKFISYDDQYLPAKAIQTAKRLIDEDKVFLVAGNMGTATNKAALDTYAKKGIPVIMSATGAKEFVEPPIKNWIGLALINYEIEAKILLDYAVNELGAKKIAISYQNDDFGKEPLNAIKDAIKDYPGTEIVQEVGFLPTDTEFSSHAKKLSEANPDTLLNFGNMNQVVNLKKAMYDIGLEKIKFVASSNSGQDIRAFDLAGKDVWEGTYSTGYLQQITDTENEKVKLFLDEFKEQYPNESINTLSLSGWAIGQVIVEALERTGGELTWDKLIEAMYTFDEWDGSLYTNITFTKNNHYGLSGMYITQAQDGTIDRISDQITFNPETGKISMQNTKK